MEEVGEPSLEEIEGLEYGDEVEEGDEEVANADRSRRDFQSDDEET
jgi:hypothetical protein